MKHFLIILISILISHLSYAQDVDDCQKMYNSGNEKPAIKCLRSLDKKNPRDPSVKKTLVNYYAWEEYTSLSKKEANNGYSLTKNQENEFPYFFYDKKTLNRFFMEGSFTSGYRYDSYGVFLESSHNYEDNDWLIVNFQHQSRIGTAPYTESGDLLGVGLITFLNKNSYLYSMLYLSPKQSFLPTYALENEIFYYKDNNTFSLNIKYSSYLNDSALVSVSPHFRHDFESVYAGIRPTFTYTEKNVLNSFRIYGGFKFTHRLSSEIGYSSGATKEDGRTRADFTSLDASLKYKLNHSTEIGAKYNYYESTSGLNDHTYLINLLWKY